METDVKEARSQFSSLLDEVEKGREVIIRLRGALPHLLRSSAHLG